MLEIRIHGRGGQGNVVAAYLLASAAFEVNRYGQAFPNFGAERRGAPVTAFVRIHDSPIKRRNQVLSPAFLIIQDAALLHVPGVLDGLQSGGGVLVNAGQSLPKIDTGTPHDLISFNATGLAQRILGRPVPNTALLAAFLSLTGLLPQNSLSAVIKQRFKGQILEKNLELIGEAVTQVPQGIWSQWPEHKGGQDVTSA